MIGVAMPVGGVLLRQGGDRQDQEVFGISALGRAGEVERSGHHRVGVDYHHLVVGDRMALIDQNRYSLVRQIPSQGISGLLPQCAAIKDDAYLDPTVMGIGQRLGDAGWVRP